LDNAQRPPAVEAEVEKAMIGHGESGFHRRGDDVLVVTTESYGGVEGMVERLSITRYSRYQPGEYRFTFSDDKMVRCFVAFGGIAGYATELAEIEEDNPRYAEHLKLINQWYEEQTNP